MYRFSILFLLLVAACNNTPQTSENTPSTQEASQEKAPVQEGIRYEGVLPTEDGDLLSTTIILGENNTYSLLQRSQNKETNREEKGKFGWDEENKTIFLISKDGQKSYYKVDAQVLIYLADPNKKLTPEEEARVTLHQKQ